MSKFDEIRDSVKEQELPTNFTVEFPYGACPSCHEIDGETVVGRQIILFCITHRVFWRGPLTPWSPMHGEDEEQRDDWEDFGLEGFEEIQPWFIGMRAAG